MNVLLIGYGSIGKRHFEILSSMQFIKEISIVTKQNLSIPTSKIYHKINDIENLSKFDYFIIANETYNHHNSFKHIIQRVKNKIILIEKPLFEKVYDLTVGNNNVYVAYNLRFHPIIEYIKNQIQDSKILYFNVITGQYLPTWRPDQDYRKSYSSSLKKGGGVLRDLSHELDYTIWLCGNIRELLSINSKISNLEIDSDDIFTSVGRTKDNVIINLTMDYLSKIPSRQILIYLEDKTIKADLNNGIVSISNNSDITIDHREIDSERNISYKKMHESIILKNGKNVCSYHEGLSILEIIDNIPLS